MKILLMDKDVIADSLGQILMSEGHDVYASTDSYAVSRLGVKCVGWQEDCANVLDKDWDLVVACGTNVTRDGFVEKFRERGIPTLGSGAKGFTMELKDVGRQIFEEAGFKNPRWAVFDTNEVAIEFVKTSGFRKMVVKFTETNRGFRTTVCDDVASALFVLRNSPNGRVVIEEKIDGPELSLAAYWDGTKFIPTVSTMEHKRLWRGDRGVLTPEMGTLVWYDLTIKIIDIWTSLLDSPTAVECLKDYRGFIDINGIVDDHCEYVPLEFTCRYGVPQTAIMLPLIRESAYGEFLLGVAKGNSDPRHLRHTNLVAVGAVLAVCGYPYHETYPDILNIGAPIRGIGKILGDVTLGAVKLVDGVPVTDGAWVMCVTGVGMTVDIARTNCYQDVEKISFHDMIFRDDIGCKWDTAKFRYLDAGFISVELCARP